MEKEKKILFASVTLFMILMIMAFIFSKITALFINMIFLAILVLIIPYSLYRFLEFRKIKIYESEFPNFLRDLSESQRAGLSIIQAINASAKSDYGPLSREIKKMSDQLSWNIPLEKVLVNFSKRMHESKIIVRSLLIIDQANKSGGNIEDTMDSLANSIESIKDVQEEKKILLNQQVVMMYAIFFIFLGITISLIKFLLPLLQSQMGVSGSSLGLFSFNTNPCYPCIPNQQAYVGGSSCIGCSIFFSISTAFDFGKVEEAASYYKSLFFAMIIIQGFFSGLIAGQISSDSLIAGIKHSMVMVLSGFIIFLTVVKIGII